MTITASQINSSSMLQIALKEDIIVTKRNRPFVAIVDYDKYLIISEYAQRYQRELASQKLADSWLLSAQESEKSLHPNDLEFKKELEDHYKGIMGNNNA